MGVVILDLLHSDRTREFSIESVYFTTGASLIFLDVGDQLREGSKPVSQYGGLLDLLVTGSLSLEPPPGALVVYSKK